MVTTPATGQQRTGIRWTDVAWFTFFGVYTLGALGVLVQGLGAVAAYMSPDVHVELHVRGFGTA
ncbi:MAG: hypothetical protein KY453_12870, partial [Gemmatimonadetes bacterium]|nr:hypothetical protein [Gemmatimonadota bacterium]